MELNYTLIGKRIKEVRKKKRLTQERLAEITDKSTSYISYIERGKKHLGLETLIFIANALGVTPDTLLIGEIETKYRNDDELKPILEGCNIFEKKIIIDTARALKQSLRENRI